MRQRMAAWASTLGVAAALSVSTQTPASAAVQVCATPSPFNISGASSISLDVAWWGIDGVSRYRTLLSRNSDMSKAKVTYTTYPGAHFGNIAGPTAEYYGSGTKYFLSTRGVDAAGNTITPPSRVISGITGRPNRLWAPVTSRTGITWSWAFYNDPSPNSNFRVQFSTRSDFATYRTRIVELDGPIHSDVGVRTTFTGLTPGKPYWVRVKWNDTSPEQNWAYGKAYTETRSPGPKDLEMAARTKTSMQWAWAPYAGAARYQVQLSSWEDFRATRGTSVSQPTASFASLTCGTFYYARVRAVDSSGTPLTAWARAAIPQSTSQ